MNASSIAKGWAAVLLGGALLLAAPWLSGAGTAWAAYPDGPVEMTVLFGNGSSADLTARVLADGMSKRLKAPVPVVNRTGGGGAVGYTYVKNQPADGYNLVWNSDSISTAHYAGNMPFDYSAFEPVARVSLEVPALAVRADSPWQTLKAFLDYAVAHPDQVKVGISGKGSFTHLASATLFAAGGGAKVRYIPYGQGNATTELLGGRIDAALQWPSVFKAHVEDGKLRILAVTSKERIPLLPEVKTAAEQGVDVDVVMWRGVAAPKGTPRDVIERLQAAIHDTVNSAEFKDAGAKIGFTPAYLPASDFGSMIKSKDHEVAELMGELGLKK
jgi:putative tricarboxylic transport membrane protein